MPTQLQIRRGSTTDHNSFTGAAGELTVDTTKDTLRVHDGSTAGGFELARADGSNLNNITSNVIFNASVGIGTDSPSNALTVVDSTSYGQLRLSSSDADATIKYSGLSFDQYATAEEGYAGILGFSNGTENRLAIGGSTGLLNAATAIQFFTAASTTTTTGSEAMRINSGGTVLVGKTSSASSTVGAELRQNGLIIATTSSVPSLTLNRTTSDGTIAEFRKDNTAVGSIGTSGGSLDVYSSTTDRVGLRLAQAVIPMFNGAASPNTVDLGTDTRQFKDLYLSGGAYLGGVAAANKLDDYEEGTWTPTLIGSTSGSATIGTVSSASYTKIGNLVHARVYCSSVDLTNGTISGSVRIGGFPFSAVSFSGRLNVHYSDLFTASPVTTGISGYASGTSFILRQGSSQVPFTDSDLSNTTNAAFMVDITYATSA